MAPSHEVGDGSPDPSSELSSGSVVFSLPHLRNAVFTFHRQALFAQRDSILGEPTTLSMRKASDRPLRSLRRIP